MVQVGVRREDGAVLVQTDDRGDGWCPPGGNVDPGQDWVEAARACMAELTGERIEVDEPVLLDRSRFVPEDAHPNHEDEIRLLLD